MYGKTYPKHGAHCDKHHIENQGLRPFVVRKKMKGEIIEVQRNITILIKEEKTRKGKTWKTFYGQRQMVFLQPITFKPQRSVETPG